MRIVRVHHRMFERCVAVTALTQQAHSNPTSILSPVLWRWGVCTFANATENIGVWTAAYIHTCLASNPIVVSFIQQYPYLSIHKTYFNKSSDSSTNWFISSLRNYQRFRSFWNKHRIKYSQYFATKVLLWRDSQIHSVRFIKSDSKASMGGRISTDYSILECFQHICIKRTQVTNLPDQISRAFESTPTTLNFRILIVPGF